MTKRLIVINGCILLRFKLSMSAVCQMSADIYLFYICARQASTLKLELGGVKAQAEAADQCSKASLCWIWGVFVLNL